MKKSIYLVFGLSAVCLLLALAVTAWFIHRLEPEQQRIRLERKLAAKEKRVSSIVEITARQIGPSLSLPDETKQYLIRLYEKEGAILMVYSDDSLVFWSSTAIPLDHLTEASAFQAPVLFMQNGWYLVSRSSEEDHTVIGLWLIKGQYPYQNAFLDNTFQRELHMTDGVGISLEQNRHTVSLPNGTYLFSLIFPGVISITVQQAYVLFILYLLFLMFFINGLFLAYKRLLPFLRSKVLMFTAFAIDVIIVRFVIFYFKIPHLLYESDLFRPQYYGSSLMLPSLGDLVVTVLLLLFIAYAFFVSVTPHRALLRRTPPVKFLLSFLCFLGIFLLMEGVLVLFRGLIMDSNLSLDLNNLFDLTFSSLLAFGVMACLLLCFFLVSYRVFTWIYLYVHSFKRYLVLLVMAMAVYAGLCLVIPLGCNAVILAFLFVYMLSLWMVRRKRLSLVSFYHSAYFLLLFSVLSTYMLHTFNHQKEKEHRKWMAMKLSVERDKISEYMFSETNRQILSDTLLQEKLWGALNSDSLEKEVIRYIEDRYLDRYRTRYHYQITLCGQDQLLEIQPGNYEVSCVEFFNGMIREIGKTTASENFYFLGDGTEDINYLAVFQFPGQGQDNPISLFLELYSKYVPKALGYPELLIDQKATVFTDLTNYSYAIYKQGTLIKSVGKYFYPIRSSGLQETEAEFTFFDREGYNHLLYLASPTRSIIVSRQHDRFWGLLAPFSYLIIFYGSGLLLFLLLSVPSLHTRYPGASFKNRIQMAIIAIILTSFLVIGMTSLFYLANLNDSKNQDILSEKTHSVLIELEHKLATEPSLPTEIAPYLDGLLNKFSQVFFTDIHLYSLDGNLLASSRREIFEEGLQSARMNPQAFNQMVHQNKTVFMQKEYIGRYEFLSAYVPFRNNRDQTIAYLNLPFFARQTEIRQEISTFMTAFINIYIILIAIAIFLALFISGYITRPMQLIREKMRKLRLGRTNEKIHWPQHDEIGNLIGEYNRMIDELAKSAELLARSERESAWREMAKQVAHEIKNPLTPMKLSIQYLQKAWDERAPDWDNRLKRFTGTIIQQIDNLSLIATEFSDFAKMPQTQLERIDLQEVISHALGLFSDIQHIQFITSRMPGEPSEVLADRQQMLRVFNNLIKNSVQAIAPDRQGRIEIAIQQEGAHYLVSVSDNGSGITDDQAHHIFMPSFTTKTGGMGMGLAIVKSVIVNTGGEIWFESREGTGTTFYFRLPRYQENP